MGIEGAVPATVRAMCASAVHYPTDLLRKSVVAVSDDCYDSSSSDAEDLLHPHDSSNLRESSDRLLAADLRRRTSIPSTFAYGADIALGAEAANIGAAGGKTPEERRWRSFDCAASETTATTTNTGRSQSMDLLESRIQLESEQASKCRAKLGRDHRFGWVRAVKGVFRSSSKKEQVQLLQMHLVAEVAKSNRSLAILNDTKTLLRAMEDASSDIESSRASSVSLVDDPTTQKLLDGIENADQMLAEDSRHHILSLQSRWLQELIRLHADKKVHVAKPLGAAPSAVMQQFLSEFVRPDGSQRVPCAFDLPTVALVRFEKIVNKCKLMKPALKRALDQVCHDTMASFTRGRQSSHSSASVFDGRDARDVMQSLVREIVDAIAEEAWVEDALRPILRAFVEQMVFSRLACACYHTEATELDELNETWREQAAKAKALGLHQVGLPLAVSVVDATSTSPLFSKSIEAFNSIPHVVPSCVLAAFLNAVRVVYHEANQTLGVSANCMSADVLLPLLVFVLSRGELPHLHSQVYLMKEFAIDESQEGSEAAYYLACLQAAMGYIMTRDASAACT